LSRSFQNQSFLAAESFFLFVGLPFGVLGLSPTSSASQSSDPTLESSGSSLSEGGGGIPGEV